MLPSRDPSKVIIFFVTGSMTDTPAVVAVFDDVPRPYILGVEEDAAHTMWVSVDGSLVNIKVENDFNNLLIQKTQPGKHDLRPAQIVVNAARCHHIQSVQAAGHNVAVDRFEPRVYGGKDGLQNCTFNQRSLARLDNGDIVAGGLMSCTEAVRNCRWQMSPRNCSACIPTQSSTYG